MEKFVSFLRDVRTFRLILSCIVVAACARPVPQSLSLADARAQWEATRLARVRLKTLRAEARVTVISPERRLKFSASLLVADPDRLYVEASALGFPNSIVASDGKVVDVFMPSEGVIYRGNDLDFSKLLGVMITGAGWTNILLGNFPSMDGEIRRGEIRGREWRLETTIDHRDFVIVVDRRTGWLSRLEDPTPDGLRVEYRKPRKTSYGLIASEITVSRNGKSCEIFFSRMEPNVAIADEHLTLAVPDGIRVESIDRLELFTRD